MENNETPNEETNPEVEKYLKKIKSQQAQIQTMQLAQQEAEREMQIAQQQEEQMLQQQWIDSTRVMVSKNALCNLYLCLFTGAQHHGFQAIDVLCASITTFDGQAQEERMLVDKQLMEQLKICHENKDMEGQYVTANAILYSLSTGQRREIVNILVNDIKEHGGLKDFELISALQDSVRDPSFFRY